MELADARIRSDFTDTAFWKADIETDEQGYAEIEVPMPDNLTTWKVKVWAMGHGTVVGQGETEVITSKDLLVRLQAPRFFVEKDEVTLSAVVHNNLGGSRKVKVSLELEGDHLVAKDLVKEVSIEAGETNAWIGWPRFRKRASHRSHEGPNHRRCRCHGDELPRLCPRSPSYRVLERCFASWRKAGDHHS